VTWRAVLLALAISAAASAQTTTRRATNVASLVAHPGFFHLRQVAVVGTVKLLDTGELRLSGDSGSIQLVYKGPGSAREGLDEVRGELWDLGRFNADDPRLSGYDLKRTFKIDPEAPWPKPGQVTAIVASAITEATQPSAPSVRNIVLFPSRYVDQKVTLVGQFGGRNLLGDLPDAPGQSRYDFVLRSADAAIWVTNLRPRGKDFELAVDARIDTGRWLEVTGTLQQGRGLQWLDGQAGTIKTAQAPREPTDEPTIRVPPGPPPEVVFSTPTPGETDVGTSARVRIQFSRDIDGATLRNRIRIAYVDAGASPNDAAGTRSPNDPAAARPTNDPAGVRSANDPAAATAIAFTPQYLPGTRVLEIKLTSPLEPFRAVRIQLLEGILGTDKQALKPWTLSFETGNQ
jgi:hypothetical protein